MPIFERQSFINTSASELFDWHGRAGAFERLSPPWQPIRVEEKGAGLDVGSQVRLKMATPLGWRKWVAKHVTCEKDRMFEDVQVSGPFSSWRHRHSFIPAGGDKRTELVDRIEYALPGGPIADAFAGSWVRKQLEKTFSYRHEITRCDMELWERTFESPRLRILVAGGSGFLGSRLRALMESQGHDVFVLSRRPVNEKDIAWEPAKEELEVASIEGFDAVINLGGSNIASGRWSEKRKTVLWNSRIDPTRLLVDRLSECATPPKVFLSASGVGFYGDGGDTAFDEKSPEGNGFLPPLCAAWENEALKAQSFGARVALLRTGVVLSGAGGALKLMSGPFRCGLGGRLGSGQQWFPWIALEDWLYAVYEILTNKAAAGPYNLASPEILRNEAFTRSLAGYLNRPAFFHVPAKVIQTIFGEMADETLLVSQKALPSRLTEELGFQFRYSNIGEALQVGL